MKRGISIILIIFQFNYIFIIFTPFILKKKYTTLIMNKTIYYSLILIINLLNYLIISKYTIYSIINIILLLIIFILLQYTNVINMTMSVINPLPLRDYNNFLNNINLYSMEYSKNTIVTEFVNNSTNNNLSTPLMGMEEEDNIGTDSSNNLNSLEDKREKAKYHTLVAFSSVKKFYTHSHQTFYNIIGSSVFTTSDIDLVFENINNNNLISQRLRLLNGKSITLCVILPGLEPYTIEKIKINDSIDIDFNLIKMSENYFFDEKSLNEFIKCDFSKSNMFFFFKETS